MSKLSQYDVAAFLKMLRGQEIHIDSIMKELLIAPELRNQLRAILGDLKNQKLVKPSGLRDGWYKVLRDVKPVKWREADETQYFELCLPYSHEDQSHFGFEGKIKLSPGDLVVLSGVSNTGKSAIALNILGENVDKYECVLMGNEYTALDGIPSPKFKRRMLNMKWVNWVNNNGNDKFLLLPVREDYEDYIEPNKLNIIDWINLTDQFYKIGKILEDIKAAIGSGLAIVVLQKEEDAKLGRGKGFTRDLADLYITIDPYGTWQSRLQIEKAKEPKGRIYGRHWAFEIVDNGANLHHIREIFKCTHCWGRGYTKMGTCDNCQGLGYLDKED